MKIEIHLENENDTINNFVLAREVYRICDLSSSLNAKAVAEMIKIQYKVEYENERE